jgi:hypothetical protein
MKKSPKGLRKTFFSEPVRRAQAHLISQNKTHFSRIFLLFQVIQVRFRYEQAAYPQKALVRKIILLSGLKL